MRIAVVGSGNFGSVVARNVARNIKPMDNFHKTVKMWVHDELVNGKSLIEIINTQHMNVKYLPGVALPPTVEAVSDVLEVCAEADILLFVVPHQFLPGKIRLCPCLHFN
jgi:glycerol-3-phosphate dehydrogenase (NAD+)